MCFAAVLLCVQHFVLDTALVELTRKELALFHADGSDKNRLTIFILLSNFIDNSSKLCTLIFVDEVGLIETLNRFIGGNRDNSKLIGVDKFCCFGLSSTGHTREFFVHAEIVLQCDGGKSLVFLFNFDAFFGLNCLVNTFTPAATFKNTTCKFVDDFYFTTLDDVVLIAFVQLFCFQRHL